MMLDRQMMWAACRLCVSFQRDAGAIENELPGLAVLGSALACVLDEDGVCRKHDRHVGAGAICDDFKPK